MTKLIAANIADYATAKADFDLQKSSFWCDNHPLSADCSRLYEELVPESGACATIEGECLRAVSQINYECFNNGFGNNKSGALNFLNQHFEHPQMIVIYNDLYKPVIGDGIVNKADHQFHSEYLCQEVVKSILATNNRTPFTGDMYSLNEESDLEEENDWDDDWEDDWGESEYDRDHEPRDDEDDE